MKLNILVDNQLVTTQEASGSNLELINFAAKFANAKLRVPMMSWEGNEVNVYFNSPLVQIIPFKTQKSAKSKAVVATLPALPTDCGSKPCSTSTVIPRKEVD